MTVRETYLGWMRYALWGGNPPDPPVDDEVLSLADRQKTRGLIIDALLRDSGRKDAHRAEQRLFLFQTFNTHRMLDAALVRAVTVLRDAGIPAVLLKGQGVARNYPNPLLRECGDIDLYIGPDRLDDAVRALTPLADRVIPETDRKHRTLWIGEAKFELHRESMTPTSRRQARFYHSLETEGLSNGLFPLDFDGVRVDTPECTFNALFLFYHAWDHFLSGGIGLRQLCDWALLLHAQQARIDRDRLGAMLDGMRLRRAWQLFGCIAVQDLGLPQESFPFYDGRRLRMSRRVLQRILAEGNFGEGRGLRSERPKTYLADKAYWLGVHFRRFLETVRIAPRDAWQTFREQIAIAIRHTRKDLFRL